MHNNIVILLALVIASIYAYSPFSKNVINEYVAFARDALKNNPNPEVTFYSLEILNMFSNLDEYKNNMFCKRLTEQLHDANDIRFISYSLRSSAITGCQIHLSPEAKDTIDSVQLANFNDLISLIYVHLIAHVQDTDTIHSLVKELFKFKQSDGSFRNSLNPKSSGNLYNTALLYELFYYYPQNNYTNIIQSIYKLLIEELEEAEILSFEDTYPIYTTSFILSSYLKVGTGKVTHKHSVGFTNFFLSNINTRNIRDIYSLSVFLNTVKGVDIEKPLIIDLLTNSVSIKHNNKILLNVVDIFGQPQNKINIILVNLKSSQDNIVNIKGVHLKDNFEFKLPTNLASGVYTLFFEVDSNKSKTSYSFGLTILTDITISDIIISVQSQRDTKASYVANYPNSLAQLLDINSNDILSITFNIINGDNKEFIAQQVSIAFAHPTGVQAVFYPSFKKNAYSLTLNMKDNLVREKFEYLSGVFTMKLIVGDLSLAKSIIYTISETKIELPVLNENYPLYYRPLLYDSDVSLKPLPEIHHIFHKPATVANPIFSSLFSLLTIIPMAIYILYTLSHFSFYTPYLSIIHYIIVFHGLLLLSLILLFYYWIKLDMFTTLSYLFCISIGLMASGYYLFSNLDLLNKPKQKVD